MYPNKNIIGSDLVQFNVGGIVYLTFYSNVTKKLLNPYNIEKFYSPHYLQRVVENGKPLFTTENFFNKIISKP